VQEDVAQMFPKSRGGRRRESERKRIVNETKDVVTHSSSIAFSG